MTMKKTNIETTVRNIALNRLVPSKDNVRKVYSASSVEQLAASIEAHRLLQNLTVRPERDAAGKVTGRFEVLAGGRRLAALRLLARRKRIAKDAPIACNVRDDGVAAELSLAENIEREALHPADEFEAFRRLHTDEALGADAIATRFGVSPRRVRERLKLAAVSPVLLQHYREGTMSLEQVMALTVCDDPVRQEQVWQNLAHDPSPWHIRRALLEHHIAASDGRVRFVGLDSYQAAGGATVRDLFEEDDGGYLSDPALLDSLAKAKLEQAADGVRAEGWKWVEPVLDFPHGHGFARVYAKDIELPENDARRMEQLEEALQSIEARQESGDDAASAAYDKLLADLEGLTAASRQFVPADLARAGAFVTIGEDGRIEVVRGFVRPEDEQPERMDADEPSSDAAGTARNALSDRLTANLTAHRTLALRAALGASPDAALVALTHVLALQLFYDVADLSCLQIVARHQSVERFAPEANASPAAQRIGARHEGWVTQLPRDAADLWSFVRGQSEEDRQALLAHCVSCTLWCVAERAGRGRDDSVDQLAEAVSLDMRQSWRATAQSYFRHVSKSSILDAVSEAVSPDAATRIASLKKSEMAGAAEHLLQDTGWLPELLRPASTPATEQCVAAAE